MQYKLISLQEFTEREAALKNITRYDMYSPMFYRTNLQIHTQRVLWLLEELLPSAIKVFPNFNIEKARILALIHDDAEIITGDIQLGRKLYMSKEQLAEIDKNEAKAIEILSEKYPKTINGFSYKELLYNILKNDCIEVKLVRYTDKCDAFGEALHEIFGGNSAFCSDHPDLEKGVNPINNYIKILKNFTKQFSDLESLFKQKHPLLSVPKPHTRESIQQKSQYPHYDQWKEIIMKRGGEKEISLLTNQKEFPKPQL